MPTVRIRSCSGGESRLGRLALAAASSGSIPLPPLPHQISRLVLEGVMCNPFINHSSGDISVQQVASLLYIDFQKFFT